MKKVLLIIAHPHFKKPRVNSTVADTLAETPGFYLRNLYDLYPKFLIDVAREQEAFEASLTGGFSVPRLLLQCATCFKNVAR